MSGSRMTLLLPKELKETRWLVSKISDKASRKLSLASRNVLPWVFAPGISSIQAKYQFPDFLYIAVYCFRFILRLYHNFLICKYPFRYFMVLPVLMT